MTDKTNSRMDAGCYKNVISFHINVKVWCNSKQNLNEFLLEFHKFNLKYTLKVTG